MAAFPSVVDGDQRLVCCHARTILFESGLSQHVGQCLFGYGFLQGDGGAGLVVQVVLSLMVQVAHDLIGQRQKAAAGAGQVAPTTTVDRRGQRQRSPLAIAAFNQGWQMPIAGIADDDPRVAQRLDAPATKNLGRSQFRHATDFFEGSQDRMCGIVADVQKLGLSKSNRAQQFHRQEVLSLRPVVRERVDL